jgi:uncharacterized phiE125 gp8 family phage protein
VAALTVQDCKDYLRIEHTAEDTMLIGWLASAAAAVEQEVGRPLDPVLRTFIIERPVNASKLFVPLYPIAVEDSSAATADLELTDGDGTVLTEDTDYRLDVRTGVITAINSDSSLGCFSTYPYTIECYVGLAALPEYEDKIEPALNAAILDVLADRYQRRSPAATSEATGGEVSTGYAGGLPQRVIDMLAPWRVAHVVHP